MQCECELEEIARGGPGKICAAHFVLVEQKVLAERERIILAVDEMCGSHNLTKRLRERVGAAT